MSRLQLQDSEAADLPDKAILATVLSYLKNKNLKETEEALRKELSHHGDENTASFGDLQLSAVGQSGIEPVKYEDSYTSFAPLPTTTSQTIATTTTADFPQLAKVPLTSTLPSISSSVFLQQLASTQSSSYKIGASSTHPIISTTSTGITAPVYPEEKIEEEMEDDSQTLHSSPPALVPITANASLPQSTTTTSSSSSSSSSPSPTLPFSSDIFNKNPLWVSNSSTCSVPTITSKCSGLGAISSLSGISTSVPSVHTSIPLSRSLGVRNVLFQSTSNTSGMMGSNKNIAVHVPMMYQLTTHPGVTQPLLAPILTMVPPVPSVGSLTNTPSSMFMATSTSSSAFHSLIGNGNKVITPNSKMLDLEKVPVSSFTEISKKDAATNDLPKGTAEPATGQTIPFSEAAQFGSSCCSPSSSIPGLPVPRTLASIPPSELTPEQVELKGFAEDFKTRRIKLGFTQGSVGQSLAEKGYSNFAQSTISRFEQMQLSPTNAATIRVVLEQWLIEAESPEVATSSSSCAGSIPMMASRKRKKRAVFTPQTKSTLDTFFCQNSRPNRQAIEEISQELDLLPEEVRVWFCNKRQKSKPGSTSPVRSLSLGHESSLSSATSSSTPSPSPSCDGALGIHHIQKRRSASPPKMPFTIEELSKSSNCATSTTSSSPVRLMSPIRSPMGLVASDARSKIVPMIFGQHFPMLSNPLMSPFVVANHIAKTKA